jgi:hypothetical protein
MTDESNIPAETAAPAPARRGRKWKWIGIPLVIIIVLPLTVFSVWAFIAMSYTYSQGSRAGYVQKFSKKGWVCKTWEGELSMVNIPGQAQERWFFTVRNDSIARLLTGSMGNRVSLDYDEHRGIPTKCFGETSYFVTGVKTLGP